MATKKRTKKKATAKKEKTPKVVEALRGARSDDWSPEWLALFAVYGGPRKFSDTLGVNYQTVWRYKSGDVPESKKLLIAMLAAHKGLKSPV
jgi:hypothetical protein